MNQHEPERVIETYRFSWGGIEIEIRFERHWLGISTGHFDVESVDPPKAKLPITETGYRSIFIPAETVDEAGGPVAFIVAELNYAAKGEAWQAAHVAQRQLSLF